MKKGRLGFTLIEVSLFLAITGLLFFGVTIGVQTSINQQRYNDAVQSFMEFLRTTYSNVLNVQSIAGRGNSEKAIYGKMLTFGEKNDLAGASITPGSTVFSYTVIGRIQNNESGNALELLDKLDANVVVKEDESFTTAGIAESYTPKWSVQIEKPCNGGSCEYTPFVGTLLIVRHPNSGTVYTFYNPNVIEVNERINSLDAEGATSMDLLQTSGFELTQVDFCLNQNPGVNSMRRDVRIAMGARNASGVELISDEDSKCKAN